MLLYNGLLFGATLYTSTADMNMVAYLAILKDFLHPNNLLLSFPFRRTLSAALSWTGNKYFYWHVINILMAQLNVIIDPHLKFM